MSVLIRLTLFYLLATVNGEPELIITRDNNGTETLVSSTIVAIKGDDVVLSCKVMDKGNPLTEDAMTWSIKTAKHETKVAKSKLNIRAITRDKEGEYICFNTKYNLIKTMTVIVEPDKASELYGNFSHTINVNRQARVVTDENGEQQNDKDDYAFLEDDATQTKNDNLSNRELESDEDEIYEDFDRQETKGVNRRKTNHRTSNSKGDETNAVNAEDFGRQNNEHHVLTRSLKFQEYEQDYEIETYESHDGLNLSENRTVEDVSKQPDESKQPNESQQPDESKQSDEKEQKNETGKEAPNKVKDNTTNSISTHLLYIEIPEGFVGVICSIVFVGIIIFVIYGCFYRTPVNGIVHETAGEETTDPNIFINAETQAVHYNRSGVYNETVYSTCESATFPLLSGEANKERSTRPSPSKQDHVDLQPLETIPEDKSDSYYLYRPGLRNDDSSENVSECDANVSSDDTRLVSSDDN